jgi:hypothetical protein
MALLCDITAASVAVATFSDVTYCCGKPILDMAGNNNIPWKDTIRIGTYVYLGMVFLEVYPVIRKGFPFNIVNPLVGFVITLAMFFNNNKIQALAMWAVETAAIVCEFALFRLKLRQMANQEKELREVGLQTKSVRDIREGEEPDEPQKELSRLRQRYYQLKEDQLQENTVVWYLAIASYINIALSILVLTAILVISQGGGLCVDEFNLPNPFDLDQLGRCSYCANTTGVCNVCTDTVQQCYYPFY